MVDPERKILVKIVQVTDAAGALEIIAASNNQNKVSAPVLKATDPQQKVIEDYLLKHGYFYERRKKHYENKNKDLKRLVTPEYLAQSYSSIIALTPSKARSGSSQLFKKPTEYTMIFNKEIPLPRYLRVIKISNFVKEQLEYITLPQDMNTIEKSIKMGMKKKMKFHCMYMLNKIFLDGKNDIEGLLTLENLTISFNELYKNVKGFMNSRHWNATDIDGVSKNSDFDEFLNNIE